jgi:hypothetical protein
MTMKFLGPEGEKEWLNRRTKWGMGEEGKVFIAEAGDR